MHGGFEPSELERTNERTDENDAIAGVYHDEHQRVCDEHMRA